MSYGTRLTLASREIALVLRTRGVRFAVHEVRRRFYRTSESLFFAKVAPFTPPELPQGVYIKAIPPGAARDRRQEVFDAGAGFTVLNFERGAVCYVAYVEDEPAGVGWFFPESRLLRLLGVDRRGMYLGGFLVREAFRGRGLYPLLLQHICSESLRTDQTAFAEVGEENVASRRGLEKAGFTIRGRIRQTILCGVAVVCRLTPR